LSISSFFELHDVPILVLHFDNEVHVRSEVAVLRSELRELAGRLLPPSDRALVPGLLLLFLLLDDKLLVGNAEGLGLFFELHLFSIPLEI